MFMFSLSNPPAVQFLYGKKAWLVSGAKETPVIAGSCSGGLHGCCGTADPCDICALQGPASAGRLRTYSVSC
jgi:hypothetical protein